MVSFVFLAFKVTECYLTGYIGLFTCFKRFPIPDTIHVSYCLLSQLAIHVTELKSILCLGPMGYCGPNVLKRNDIFKQTLIVYFHFRPNQIRQIDNFRFHDNHEMATPLPQSPDSISINSRDRLNFGNLHTIFCDYMV